MFQINLASKNRKLKKLLWCVSGYVVWSDYRFSFLCKSLAEKPPQKLSLKLIKTIYQYATKIFKNLNELKLSPRSKNLPWDVFLGNNSSRTLFLLILPQKTIYFYFCLLGCISDNFVWSDYPNFSFSCKFLAEKPLQNLCLKLIKTIHQNAI